MNQIPYKTIICMAIMFSALHVLIKGGGGVALYIKNI